MTVIILASQTFSQENEFYGEWNGVLSLGATQLKIEFSIDENGTTLNSPNQNVFEIPATSAIADTAIVIEVPSIQGTYRGTLEDGRISGTWEQMGKIYELDLTREDGVSEPAMIKRFSGELQLPGSGSLSLVLKVFEDLKGNLSATFDSPDQGAYGIPVSQIILDDESLKFEVSSIGGDYSGMFNTDSGFYSGTWAQAGSEFPLNLKENYDEEVINRPQEPERPFPYNEEEVSFMNESAEINLAGTFTYPDTGEKFPAVVLVSGSGAQNRDEEIFNHKPFLVLSDFLTRNGIAVLRYDDRGTAESGGKFAGATTEDFSYDAEAAVEYLSSRKEVDTSAIGIIGHSEGGIIAPMIANRNNEIDFLVLMAGPGLPGDSIILKQSKLLMRAGGASEEDIAKAGELQRKIVNIIHSETDTLEIRAKIVAEIKEMIKDTPEGEDVTDEIISSQAKRWVNTWMVYFLRYDPRPALKKLKIPVLAIIGGKDLQVPAEDNIPQLEKALKEAPTEKFKVIELPGLNHLFQTAETGSTIEYGQIEETISPKALNLMLDFIEENISINN